MATDLLSLITKQRKAAEKADGAALDQIVSVFSKSYGRIELSLEVSLRRMVGKGNLSKSQVTSGLKDFQRTTSTELQSFADWMQTSIPAWSTGAMVMGGAHSVELLKYLSQQATVNAIDYSKLSISATEQMLGFLAEGSPLFERIQQLSPFYSEAIMQKMVEGIAGGIGPRQTAKEIEPFISGILNNAKNEFANPMADALRTTRTAQLWSYREASRNNYQANSDIITGYQWASSLDVDVCMACASLDGKVFPTDEVMDGHFNCRCSLIPVILNEPAISETRGQDYFESLSEDEQRAMMGPGKFEAWQAGQFEFGALSTQREEPTWGTMRFETPLKDLVATQ